MLPSTQIFKVCSFPSLRIPKKGVISNLYDGISNDYIPVSGLHSNGFMPLNNNQLIKLSIKQLLYNLFSIQNIW